MQSVAIVGCGYVAALYAQTFANHPELKFVGAYDSVADRTHGFSQYFAIPAYESLEALLTQSGAEIVANLTNPRDHLEVTKACLNHGKHVYSEKPLAMGAAEATELAAHASTLGMRLASAPCNMLSEAVQTMWKTIEEGRLGRIRMIYAEMDDGMVHLEDYPRWRTVNGIQWPAKDEFEIGCTYEHAGYHLGILAQIFGPVRRLTSFSSCQAPEKGEKPGCISVAPDFSVGCLEYDQGIVARITCSIIAPSDRSLTVIGDRGRIVLDDVWNYGASLHIHDTVNPYVPPKRDLASKVRRKLGLEKPAVMAPERVPLVRDVGFRAPKRAHPMDFCRGIAELAAAIREDRPCRLSQQLAVHITELTELLQQPAGQSVEVRSSFAPIAPMPWAGFKR
jgi:predicted dehydrogenase